MLSYLYYILGYDNDVNFNSQNEDKNENKNIKKNETEDEYLNKEIMNIKSNLKKVKPIKKNFYCPTIKELNIEINKRQNKIILISDEKNNSLESEEVKKQNIYIPNKEELIKSKNSLRKCKKENLIKKTFTDELKLTKLNLKKTTINYRIENFCHTYLDKFEKKRKYRNYVVTI